MATSRYSGSLSITAGPEQTDFKTNDDFYDYDGCCVTIDGFIIELLLLLLLLLLVVVVVMVVVAVVKVQSLYLPLPLLTRTGSCVLQFLRLACSPILQVLPALVVRLSTFRCRLHTIETRSSSDEQFTMNAAQATGRQITAVIWLAIRTPGHAVVLLGPLAQVVQRGATVCGVVVQRGTNDVRKRMKRSRGKLVTGDGDGDDDDGDGDDDDDDDDDDVRSGCCFKGAY